jgi:hypothetical protein
VSTHTYMKALVGSVAAHHAAPIAAAGPIGGGNALSPRTLIGLLAVVLLVFGGMAIYQRIRARRSGIAGVDRMDVKTFEESLTSLFRQLGYEVEGTRCHGDFAAELVVVDDGGRMVVEGKRWGKSIGVNAVQTAITARGDFACDRAMVVANRQFTGHARRLAKSNGVELWDREALIGKLLKLHGVPAASGATPELAAPDPGIVPTPVAGASAAAPVMIGSADEREVVPARPAPVASLAVAQAAATTTPAISKSAAAHGDVDVVDDPHAFASCALCGITVTKNDRTLCLTQRTRFGGKVYCGPHQALFGVASA